MITIARYSIGRRSLFVLVPMLLAFLLGCGYKGPLYLPPPPDTISGKGSVLEQPQQNIPTESKNPSLEPAPIVIE